MQTFALPRKQLARSSALAVLLIILFSCFALVLHQPRALPQLQELTIKAWCDGGQFQTIPSSFSVAGCQQQAAQPADPQGRLLWLELPFELPSGATEQPLALFIFAKASSAVYLNGQLVGQNGQPGDAATESAGQMDSRIYLPSELLRTGSNQLVLLMSAQQGWFRLAQPIHFIGIGPYGDVSVYLQQYTGLGLLILGVLCTGLLYFSALALLGNSSAVTGDAAPIFAVRGQDALLALLCLCAAAQLWLEMSRGLLGYPYPLHELRLCAILLCACGFGFALLWLTLLRYQPQRWRFWTLLTLLVLLPVLWWLDSFDGRIAIATLLPAALAALIAAVHWYQAEHKDTASTEGAGTSAVLLLLYLILAVVLNGIFQEILAFLLVTLLLCGLFIEQALQRQQQLRQQLADQQLILQLQLQLQQNQSATPKASLTLTSAGKVQRLLADDIAYCQAARDYSEIWLTDGRQHLYSGTIKALEQELPGHFIRVHRSYLVNAHQVRQFRTTTDADSGSGAVLILASGQQVPVSRRLIPAVRSAMLTPAATSG